MICAFRSSFHHKTKRFALSRAPETDIHLFHLFSNKFETDNENNELDDTTAIVEFTEAVGGLLMNLNSANKDGADEKNLPKK